MDNPFNTNIECDESNKPPLQNQDDPEIQPPPENQTSPQQTLSPEQVAQSVLDKRQIRVFHPSNVRFDPRKLDLPDDFFDPTPQDVRTQVQENATNLSKMQDRPLLTKKLRDDQERSRMSRFPNVVIRVIFPDRVAIQGIFTPSSTIREVIRFVRASLLDARNVNFHLFVVPPKKKLLDLKKNLWDEKLVPAAVLHIAIETGPAETSNLLKAHLINSIEDTPESILSKIENPPSPQPDNSIQESSEQKSPRKSKSKSFNPKKAVPKWFKKK